MELSKLTICRQDVIIGYDSDVQSNKCPDNRKKFKNKLKCVRKVHLSTTTVDRIVPLCYRTRCRGIQHYHKITSRNNKFINEEAVAQEKVNKNSAESDHASMAFIRELSSPITIDSSDTYENISSCCLHSVSSDSDELEELIKSTRQRMKKEKLKNTTKLLNISANTPPVQVDYDNITSNDDDINGSLHSMDTVVLQTENEISFPALTPEQPIDVGLLRSSKQNTDVVRICSSQNDNELVLQDIPSPFSQESNGNLSPLYEISGKVFMEHYLNSSII